MNPDHGGIFLHGLGRETRRSVTVTAFLVVVFPASLRTEILPSFNLEWSAWEATHIIVATEGKKIDGVLEVVESWKGSLKPGEIIVIPELAEFAKDEARIVPLAWFERNQKEGERPRITGTRMILFLREPGRPLIPREQNVKRGWSGAETGGEVRYATVWVEDKRLFAFQQLINPGPTQLTDVTHRLQSELKIKGIVRQHGALRRDVDQALAIENGAERAKALYELAYVPDRHVHWTVFKALEECGNKATPWLRRLLQDDSMSEHYTDATMALHRADAQKAGGILTELLREDLPYWRGISSTLKAGWKQPGGQDFESKIDVGIHFARVSAIMHTLPSTKHEACRPIVREFMTMWEKMPLPTDNSSKDWNREFLEQCRRALVDQ